MAQQGLIARAGKGLLDFFVLLLRGIGALCAAFGSFILFAWKNSDESSTVPNALSDTEKQMRDLDPNFKNGGFYNYDRY